MQKNRVSEACFGASFRLWLQRPWPRNSGAGLCRYLPHRSLPGTPADHLWNSCTCHCSLRNLRPGDELLSPVGKPYDTLEEVIGIRPSNGSLAEYGVKYRQVDLLEDGTFDYENIRKAVNEKQSW